VSWMNRMIQLSVHLETVVVGPSVPKIGGEATANHQFPPKRLG